MCKVQLGSAQDGPSRRERSVSAADLGRRAAAAAECSWRAADAERASHDPAQVSGGQAAPQVKPFTKAQVKNLAVRKWLSVSATGEATVLEVDKLRVTHQLGVQLRDLRWVLGPPRRC